jgi:YD repeat-containing protein
MVMKKLVLCLSVFSILQAVAQPQQADIIKFKIAKAILTYDDNTYEYFYDERGNDTALYKNGELSYSLKHELDNKGRILKTIKTSPYGETETTVYTYSADGSFTAENRVKEFGMVVKETYDKKGRIIKKMIPDGSQYLYTYNVKGNLIKVVSVPSKDGIKFTTAYAYNTKGQLIAVKNSGEYAWTEKYNYDAKGLLTSSELTNTIDRAKAVTIRKYAYEFR